MIFEWPGCALDGRGTTYWKLRKLASCYPSTYFIPTYTLLSHDRKHLRSSTTSRASFAHHSWHPGAFHAPLNLSRVPGKPSLLQCCSSPEPWTNFPFHEHGNSYPIPTFGFCVRVYKIISFTTATSVANYLDGHADSAVVFVPRAEHE